MEQSVIFNSPILLLGLAVSLVLFVVCFINKSGGYVLSIISAAVAVATLTYALLLGAAMQEVLIAALIFFLISLTGFKKKRG